MELFLPIKNKNKSSLNSKNFLILLLLSTFLLPISIQQINQQDQSLSNSTSTKNLPTKRIIAIIFPGGRTHNFVYQNLFDYTVLHEDKFRYEYYLITHKADYDLWEEHFAKQGESFKYFIYGDKDSYDKSFNQAVEIMNENAKLGFSGFGRAMISNLQQFMESGILSKLKKLQTDSKSKTGEDFFHMIITDVPNYIHKVIYQELDLKLSVYLVPALIHQVLYPNFEFNPSYNPTIGSTFPTKMNFIQRFMNSFIFFCASIYFDIMQLIQLQIINSYGFDIHFGIHIHESMHMIQYPLGLCFPFSTPPNWVMLNSITAKKADKVKNSDPELDKFLNLYKKNIYFSQGTIMNCISSDILKDILSYCQEKKIGVIVSIRKDLISDEELNKLPSNVYATRWLDQNNLLGDDRLNVFITHAGYNSVQESTYHGKPMVAMGVGLDQYNVANFVKELKIGEVFQKRNMINSERLINAIEKVLENKEYTENAKRQSEVMKDLKNPREEFKYYLDFGLKHGYSSLEIQAYKYKYRWIIVNGYDVLFVWLIILFLIGKLILKIIQCIHDCLCGKCENKHKNRGGRKKNLKID